jgi:hypothetical protein
MRERDDLGQRLSRVAELREQPAKIDGSRMDPGLNGALDVARPPLYQGVFRRQVTRTTAIRTIPRPKIRGDLARASAAVAGRLARGRLLRHGGARLARQSPEHYRQPKWAPNVPSRPCRGQRTPDPSSRNNYVSGQVGSMLREQSGSPELVHERRGTAQRGKVRAHRADEKLPKVPWRAPTGERLRSRRRPSRRHGFGIARRRWDPLSPRHEG